MHLPVPLRSRGRQAVGADLEREELCPEVSAHRLCPRGEKPKQRRVPWLGQHTSALVCRDPGCRGWALARRWGGFGRSIWGSAGNCCRGCQLGCCSRSGDEQVVLLVWVPQSNFLQVLFAREQNRNCLWTFIIFYPTLAFLTVDK